MSMLTLLGLSLASPHPPRLVNVLRVAPPPGGKGPIAMTSRAQRRQRVPSVTVKPYVESRQMTQSGDQRGVVEVVWCIALYSCIAV